MFGWQTMEPIVSGLGLGALLAIVAAIVVGVVAKRRKRP